MNPGYLIYTVSLTKDSAGLLLLYIKPASSRQESEVDKMSPSLQKMIGFYLLQPVIDWLHKSLGQVAGSGPHLCSHFNTSRELETHHFWTLHKTACICLSSSFSFKSENRQELNDIMSDTWREHPFIAHKAILPWRNVIVISSLGNFPLYIFYFLVATSSQKSFPFTLCRKKPFSKPSKMIWVWRGLWWENLDFSMSWALGLP